jgi:hypothetical protein
VGWVKDDKMTMALCLYCGEIKFGALCECTNCKAGATGNQQLDIAFTDWFHEVETLEALGGIIKEIEVHSQDPNVRFWAFIHYVSENHPSILSVELKPEIRSAVKDVLKECTMPVV